MLSHALLLTILVEAEGRRDDASLPQEARERSAETVSLCKQRMAMEGLTRSQFEEIAQTQA